MIELKVLANFFCGFHCAKLFGYTSQHVSVCTNFVIDRKFVNKTTVNMKAVLVMILNT